MQLIVLVSFCCRTMIVLRCVVHNRAMFCKKCTSKTRLFLLGPMLSYWILYWTFSSFFYSKKAVWRLPMGRNMPKMLPQDIINLEYSITIRIPQKHQRDYSFCCIWQQKIWQQQLELSDVWVACITTTKLIVVFHLPQTTLYLQALPSFQTFYTARLILRLLQKYW